MPKIKTYKVIRTIKEVYYVEATNKKDADKAAFNSSDPLSATVVSTNITVFK